jgi:hypothetical protein
MQKVKGSVTFHTAMSRIPQPKPGMAKGPGPMKVADDQLRSVLGITDGTGHETAQPGRGGFHAGRRPMTAVPRSSRRRWIHAMTIGSSLMSPARVQARANGKALFESAVADATRWIATRKGRVSRRYGRTRHHRMGSVFRRLKKAKIVWKEDTLDRWLTDTRSSSPDNDMTFHIEKADEPRDYRLPEADFR